MRITLTLLALICSSLTSGVCARAGYTPRPIPSKPSALTQREFKRLCAPFYHREIVDEYKRASVRDPKWDAKALAFLEAFADRVSGKENALQEYALLRPGQAAVDAGCDDPMVLSCYGTILYDDGNRARDLLQRAVDGFAKSRYHKYRARYAANRLWRISNGAPEEIKRLQDLEVKWMLDSFSDGSFRAGEQRIALDSIPTQGNDTKGGTFYSGEWNDILRSLQNRRGIDPYTRNVLCADCHVVRAWGKRGTGWASEVTSAGWQSFQDEMNVARKLLVGAYRMHPGYPEAPTRMVEIAGVGCAAPGETARMWLDRVLSAQIDYEYAYYLFFWFGQPRWGGSLQELYDFAVACVKSGRFDTDVPWQFFRGMNGYITNACDGDARYWQKPATTKYLNMMFDGYAKSGYGRGPYWYQSMNSAVSAYCGRYSDARRILLKLGTHVDPAPYRQYYGVDYDQIRRRVFALGGPHGTELRRAERLTTQGKPSEALAMYKQAEPHAADDAETQAFVRQRIADLTALASLYNGDWASLRPPSNLDGWSVDGGKWSVADDGTIEGCVHSGFELLYCQRFRDCYEIQVDVEFPAQKAPGFGAGIIIQPQDSEERGPTYVYCSAADQKVAVANALHKELWSVGANVREHNLLLIQVWGNEITVSLNGTLLTKRVRADLAGSEQPSNVGIGYWYFTDGPCARFHNLCMRILKKDPAGD